MRLLAVSLLLALVAPSPGQAPKGKAPTAKEAEAAVRAWVFGFPTDRDSVKFLKWGPHDLGAKAGVRYDEVYDAALILPRRFTSKDEPLPLARCRWQMLNEKGVVQVYDMICGIHKGAAVFMIPNPHGDRWVSEIGKKAKK